MNARRLFVLALALGAATTALTAAAAAQDIVRGARHPALSPDGRWLAFSCRCDLWKVNSAGGLPNVGWRGR